MIHFDLQENNPSQPDEFSTMELNALVGVPGGATNASSENPEAITVTHPVNSSNSIVHNASSSSGAGSGSDEPFDTLDTFLRELQADLAEASQSTSSTTSLSSSCKRQRYNIAAANPLLAGMI